MKQNKGNAPSFFVLAFMASLIVLFAGSITESSATTLSDINDIIKRSYIEHDHYFDQYTGVGGFTRKDKFTNVSNEYKIFLNAVERVFLDPEDLGYSDFANENWNSIKEKAISLYPVYHHWGGIYWIDFDPPLFQWVQPSPESLNQIVLSPGESFILDTIAQGTYDTYFCCIAGELVMGYNFTGIANPIPEPATMLLFSTGLAGLAALKRKQKGSRV